MQADYFDRYSRGESIVHRVDARWKILIALLLVGVTVTIPSHWSVGYLLVAVAVLCALVLARTSLRCVFRRLAVAAPLLVLVAAGIPLSRGLTDGFDLAGLVLMRGLLCLLVMLALIATTPFVQVLAALERFRVPRILIWMLAFMYRYMFVLGDELHRMRRAKTARTFHRSFWTELRLTGAFLAVLFVRAFERAERVYAAMCARGWNGELPIEQEK